MRSQQMEIGYQELAFKQVIHDLHQQGHDTEKALKDNPYAGLALTLQPLKGESDSLRNLFRYMRQIQTDFHRTEKLVKSMKSTTPRSVSPSRTGLQAGPSSTRPASSPTPPDPPPDHRHVASTTLHPIQPNDPRPHPSAQR